MLKINLNGISGLSEVKIFFFQSNTLHVCHTKTAVGVVRVHRVVEVIRVDRGIGGGWIG